MRRQGMTPSLLLLMILSLLLPMMIKGNKMQFWAVARTWPVPMPVHSYSGVLPTLFSISCQGEMPCIRDPMQTPKIYNQTSFQLNGTLCFFQGNKNQAPPCIVLQKQNLSAWQDPLEKSKVDMSIIIAALTQITKGKQYGSGEGGNVTNVNITTLLLQSEVTVPSRQSNLKINPSNIKSGPWCEPNYAFPPTFTPCQSPDKIQKQILQGFQMTPPLRRYQFKSKGNNTLSNSAGWPWYQWLLSNEVGAMADVSALAGLLGAKHALWNISAVRINKNDKIYIKDITKNHQWINSSFNPASICVQAPFFFLTANVSTNTSSIDCKNTTCWLAECWNASVNLALIYQHLCITPLQFNFTASFNRSRKLAEFLAGNWTLEGEQLSRKLLFQISFGTGLREEYGNIYNSELKKLYNFYEQNLMGKSDSAEEAELEEEVAKDHQEEDFPPFIVFTKPKSEQKDKYSEEDTDNARWLPERVVQYVGIEHQKNDASATDDVGSTPDNPQLAVLGLCS
uniref:uncharacterized protein LOC105944874 n=1 Tax=Jaculus jaculus TaxID=51337 RepID=UPI001E1B1474|nr:uncharacterized protein LOC105944874 [Jaculus jaculus]